MKNNFIHSIRWKLIISFFLSIFISAAIVYICESITFILYHNFSMFKGLIAYLYYSVGVAKITIVVSITLFLITFFLITQKSINYLEEICDNVEKIEQGNLDINITVKSKDELGILAEKINNMAMKLKSSIEEERNTEKTKNELITSVSHDLRTPLTSIIGYLGLIEDSRYRDEEELKYYADIAYKKSNKLKKLIDDLFELTRMTHGKLKVNVSEINICNLLRQMAEEFFPIFEEANIECRLNLNDDPILVTVDPDLIARVFDNIISNAIRYGKDGKYIDIEAFKDSNECVVKIINYGKCISPDHISHIFERFYREDYSRSNFTGGGAGLGLAIAKTIIELHNGNISVSSDQDKTYFEIWLN